jgi:hypothetical protein
MASLRLAIRSRCPLCDCQTTILSLRRRVEQREKIVCKGCQSPLGFHIGEVLRQLNAIRGVTHWPVEEQ